MKRSIPIVITALLFLVLAVVGQAAGVPAQGSRLDPQNLIYTFFPVTMLQSFIGISDAQAAKISAIEAKLQSDRATAKDQDEKISLRTKAGDDVKAVLLPDQVEKLAGCALEIQILTNTFGHDRLSRITLTPVEMAQVQPIMADAVTKYLQADEERDKAVTALPPQASLEDSQKIADEREQKIQAMRDVVRSGVRAILTDAQKAALTASQAAV